MPVVIEQVDMIEKYSYCAFFDVDGTIINTRSVLSFLDYLIKEDPKCIRSDYTYRCNRIYSMLNENYPRDRINQYYYTIYQGSSVNIIKEHAKNWFNLFSVQPGFYNEHIRIEIANHVKKRGRIVLVSGSFYELLTPLCKFLKTSDVLCTRQEVIDGIFTGNIVGDPCIGEGKAKKICAFSNENNFELKKCYAYGDDITDIPMLNLVGNAHMIEPSEEYISEVLILSKNHGYLQSHAHTR